MHLFFYLNGSLIFVLDCVDPLEEILKKLYSDEIAMILQHQLKVSINTTSWLFHVAIKKQIIHT